MAHDEFLSPRCGGGDDDTPIRHTINKPIPAATPVPTVAAGGRMASSASVGSVVRAGHDAVAVGKYAGSRSAVIVSLFGVHMLVSAPSSRAALSGAGVGGGRGG